MRASATPEANPRWRLHQVQYGDAKSEHEMAYALRRGEEVAPQQLRQSGGHGARGGDGGCTARRA